MGCRRRRPLIAVSPVAPTGETVRSGLGVLLRFPELSADAPRNAAWDDLLAHADRAWTWRDPDSLAALAVCLLRLARDVVPEWMGPDTDV
jgi:hypothetical protein